VKHGARTRLDFQILSQVVPSIWYPAPVEQYIVAYMVTTPKQRHHAFHMALREYGYRVRERMMSRTKADNKPTKTDWDVGITIDALDRMDAYDTFVLMSGDGDFSQLLRHLRQNGKQTMVLCFDLGLSRDLYDKSDNVRLLDDSTVYWK